MAALSSALPADLPCVSAPSSGFGSPRIRGTRRVTADTALRLSRYFGTTDRFWLNLQTRYDLEMEKDHLGDALQQIRPLTTA